MQKTKCVSRAQMLGFAPYLHTWEGRKSQNQQSEHLACAKCASRAQAKCTLKSTPDCLVHTFLVPNRIKPTLIIFLAILSIFTCCEIEWVVKTISHQKKHC
jgi:hypothetical protein